MRRTCETCKFVDVSLEKEPCNSCSDDHLSNWISYDVSVPFHGLTPAEHERLTLVFEECSEVIQAIAKILRHGYESYHPDDLKQTTNRSLLEKELGDLRWAIGLLMDKDLNEDNVVGAEVDKASRVRKYLHHQEF